NSNSYFLVLGIYDRGYPVPNGTGNFENRNGILIDQNGNTVDVFYDIVVQVQSWNSTMTVWNGTTMESEPITLYTSVPIIIKKERMLIPPGYKFQAFGYAIGFWMTIEEVEKMLGMSEESLKNFQNWGEINL
ncbi:MAG: hypothetical protein QXP36_12555, partial [Conexivisphaerales archaeon]